MICWFPSRYSGYEVSKCGKIRSVDRHVSRVNTGKLVLYKGKEIRQQVDECGYLRVRLSVDNVKFSVRMHRLIAETFIDNPQNLPQVNHIDGNKQNNALENLEWVSNSENQIHAIATGLKEIHFAEKAIAFTGAVQVIDKYGNVVYTVCGNAQMKEKGLDFRLVSACLLGKRKSHRGYTFRKLNKE